MASPTRQAKRLFGRIFHSTVQAIGDTFTGCFQASDICHYLFRSPYSFPYMPKTPQNSVPGVLFIRRKSLYALDKGEYVIVEGV